MKETFTNSFAEMSDVELNKLFDAIEAEMARRQNQKQEQMWNAVKKAIKDYTSEFCTITVEPLEGETYYLHPNDDLQTWGAIKQREDW